MTNDAHTHSMVLLVDDQPIVGETVRRVFADCADIDFHYCTDAADAVAAAEQIKPTVILQDLVMPGIDGLTLIPRYRASASARDVPVIMLSSREDPVIKVQTFAAGASDYLVKMPDPIELVARVRLHSAAYVNRVQRDEAYRALRESQHQLLASNSALRASNQQLAEALARVKQLSGLLPMCSYCKRIRNDRNYWEQLEQYISTHSEAEFSHGVCPDCFAKVAADFGADGSDEPR
jgi:PleD family two-component response regulator